MTKERVVIVGAGLCGSVLAMRLRNNFDVTVIERSERSRPLFHEIECATGGITSTINRAEGLGGTTRYWHNALIELDAQELASAGIDPASFAAYYARAWRLFLSEAQIATAASLGAENLAAISGRGSVAHMVVPHARVNMWEQADKAFPGASVKVVYGRAIRVLPPTGGEPGAVEVEGPNGTSRVMGERIIVSAGGLATPVLLAASLGQQNALLGGYHDHPMAYVGKIRIRSQSFLKRISCQEFGPGSVRAGFVYQSRGMKSVFYLRPALSLDLRSITGEARYLLSDLRNDPFSPRKILQLLMNLEALREAILFKAKTGYLGDHYSVLMLGEQEPRADRGLQVAPNRKPSLNWSVTEEEHLAYQDGFEQFQADMAGEILDRRIIPPGEWEYRTAAHHSGGSGDFLDSKPGLGFYSVRGLPSVMACDASILRRGGVANSGVTLVALALQLADWLASGRG